MTGGKLELKSYKKKKTFCMKQIKKEVRQSNWNEKNSIYFLKYIIYLLKWIWNLQMLSWPISSLETCLVWFTSSMWFACYYTVPEFAHPKGSIYRGFSIIKFAGESRAHATI